MALVNLLLFVLMVYLGLRIAWALVGPLLGRWFVLTLFRKVNEQVERQANARARTSAPYEKEFFVAPDLKATVQPRPRPEARRTDVSGLADADVEFEELPR